ncbi:MAG: hypothetical protein IPP49_20965 [Saprospiraceae bacterium]|nr:hypothetical protein [Saprospiraceae bacterium]
MLTLSFLTPATIKHDKSTFEKNPINILEGIKFVIVNGVITVDDTVFFTENRAGKEVVQTSEKRCSAALQNALVLEYA